jgi:hypothetical protein
MAAAAPAAIIPAALFAFRAAWKVCTKLPVFKTKCKNGVKELGVKALKRVFSFAVATKIVSFVIGDWCSVSGFDRNFYKPQFGRNSPLVVSTAVRATCAFVF